MHEEQVKQLLIKTAPQEEKKILEGFIQNAKNEIAVLTEETAQEVKEAQEELKILEAEREALKTENESVQQENEALKGRKWYQMIFKKNK